MSKWKSMRRLNGKAGFTVVEMLIYAVVAIVVISAGYKLLFGQQRLYLKQRELQDVRATLRAAGNLLAYELRSASALGGDVYAISADSFAIRSIEATGTACGEHSSDKARIGVYGSSGDFTAGDSVMVYAGGNQWLVGSIDKIWDPIGGGVTACEWSGVSAKPDVVLEISLGGGTPPDVATGDFAIEAQGSVEQGNTVTFKASHPDLTCSEFDSRVDIVIDADKWNSTGKMSGCTFSVSIPTDASKLEIEIKIESDLYAQLSNDLSGKSSWLDLASKSGGGYKLSITDYTDIGAPVRSFDRVRYGLFQEDGRWWLGRQVGSAGSYEKVTGPLRPPSDNGLAFTYYEDFKGTTTSNRARVRMVDILLRGESLGVVRQAGGQSAAEQDEITIRVSLRG